jgi:hypothetical protein
MSIGVTNSSVVDDFITVELKWRDPRISNVILKLWWVIVYYKSIHREIKTRPINTCRCDERLKSETEESTLLEYTVFLPMFGFQCTQTLEGTPWFFPPCCLLWINKKRGKEKTYIRVSVRWKTKMFLVKLKMRNSTRLVDTGLVVELEHLNTMTRLIDEKFASVRGECET